MAQPYIGEIRMFAGNFAPTGWAFCHGQVLPISENDALFSLIGTIYGGDGHMTFALPNIQGRIPIHMGSSHTGYSYILGQTGGVERVTLTVNQLPHHQHAVLASTAEASQGTPTGGIWSQSQLPLFTGDTSSLEYMNTTVIAAAGGSRPHDNMMPFLAINYIISLYGIYPSQT